MDFIFDNNTPIYIQLVEQLKAYIISGELQTGQKLPSVRDLAMQCRANPNTVQKALAELENEGLIYTERTNGKFVSTDGEHIAALRRAYAQNVAARFLADMGKIGYTMKEMIDCIKELEEI